MELFYDYVIHWLCSAVGPKGVDGHQWLVVGDKTAAAGPKQSFHPGCYAVAMLASASLAGLTAPGTNSLSAPRGDISELFTTTISSPPDNLSYPDGC